MHIGFIEDTHLHGGTQIWVTEAVQAFIERGHEVTVIAPENSWVVENCHHFGAKTASYDWDEIIHKGAHNVEIWTNALKMCDVAICTVHPPRHGFHCSVFAARCIREGNLSTHLIPKTGTIVPEYLREFYLPDEKIQSSVITITDFTRQYLIDVYKIPPEKVCLIYQGTEVDRFRPSSRAKDEAKKRYPLPKYASPILGSLGSFEHRKGHPVLFEALKELARNHMPNIHLILVGDGPDEELLQKKVVDLGLKNHISFFPFTSEPNFVFELLDITVLPSLYKEGLPNVLLESMAMGVPVVSSNIGGVPELVIDSKTGYMVEPGNIAELCDAILALWNDQEKYQGMQKYVRRFITEKFNKATQFDQFLTHFEELIQTS